MANQEDNGAGGGTSVVRVAPERTVPPGWDRRRDRPPRRQRRRPSRPPREPRPARKGKLTDNPTAPTRGFSRWHYTAAGWFNVHDPVDPTMRWAPMPGMSELVERSDAQIIAKTRQLGRCTIAVVNKKGGGSKTTTAVPLAATLHTITHRPVVIVDANPAGGDTARYSGVATITIQELYRRLTKNAALKPIDLRGEGGITATRHGVLVVGYDRNVRKEDRFHRDEWDKVMDFLESHYEFIVLDMGNEITDDGALVLLKERAHVLVVPATIDDMESSLEDMAETCVRLKEFGVDPVKIDHATGVFSNGNPRHLARYRTDAVMRDDPPELTVLAEFPGDTFVVRKSRFLRGGYMKRHGLNLNKLSRKVLQDYRFVLLHVLEVAIEIQPASRRQAPWPSHPGEVSHD